MGIPEQLTQLTTSIFNLRIDEIEAIFCSEGKLIFDL